MHTILGSENGTLVANSKLISWNSSVAPSLGIIPFSFTVTQDILNSLLMNVTLTAISTYGYWNTTVNVTVPSSINTYSFSRPNNLILPYIISLFFALPFILLGLWALHFNGVSAIDGGFIQLITTTTGSKALKKQAAAGSLGGRENIPEELQKLKIRFGELKNKTKHELGGRGGEIRRAGFGTEDEIVPLTKGANYGVVLSEGEFI